MSIRSLAWLLGVICAVLISGLWLLTDEPLNPKANAALNIDIRPITNDNGFIYLLGLDAPKEEDPYTLGKNRLTQYRQWMQNPTIVTAPTIKGVQSFRAPLWFDGSDEQLIARAKDLPFVIASNPILYSRYHAFLQLKEFDTLINFDAQTTDELSEGLIIGNRFLRADVLSQALNGSALNASALIIEDINAWRAQLKLADSFSQKLLAARILAKDFSLITILAQKNAWPPDALTLLITALTPFSLQEVSIERLLLSSEFSKIGYALLDAKKNPAIIDASKDSFWPLSLSYKPNMSVNFLYAQYTTIASENNLPPRQLFSMAQTQQSREIDIPLSAWIKNPKGVAMVQNLLSINFMSYTARLWDVDVNRQLTRLVLEASLEQITTEQALEALIQEPSFRGIWDNQPPRINTDHTQLCYNGLIEDKKGLRCTSIAWLLHKTH